MSPLLWRFAGVGATALGLAAGFAGVASAGTVCTSFLPCIFANNTQATPASGIGADAAIAGESVSGVGVLGETTFNSYSTAAASGVSGYDLSTAGSSNDGVFGFSSRGTGLSGVTATGIGVLAVATSTGTGGQRPIEYGQRAQRGRRRRLEQ